MEILISIGTVIFFILAILLVILILLQSDKSAGMGILGGSSQSAFGSSTADIITKITGVMVGLFMLGSLGLASLTSYKESRIEKAFSTQESEFSEVTGKDDKAESSEKAEDNSAPDTGGE